MKPPENNSTPRKFAISDIHGCLDSFQELLELIKFNINDELYLLGDYIDRGPASKGVIDHILYLQEKKYKVKCLLGNHEQMLLSSLAEVNDGSGLLKYRSWLMNGGDTTLESFGIEEVTELDKKYIDFFENLAYYYEVDDYLLVHAGFNFSNASTLDHIFEDKEAMLWIRRWYNDINYEILGERTIVHGHTPTPYNVIEGILATEMLFLDIDAGCAYTRYPQLGRLCAFDMTNKELYFQKNTDVMTKDFVN